MIFSNFEFCATTYESLEKQCLRFPSGKEHFLMDDRQEVVHELTMIVDPSTQNTLNNFAMTIGQPSFNPVVRIGQSRMVDPQKS